MAELKTKRNSKDVEKFLESFENEKRRDDAFKILQMMKEITKMEPKMWGDSMIGFGSYHYKYASGHEGDMFLIGFSPRKQNLALYLMSGFDMYEDLLKKVGKYKLGKSCFYINKLEDVDQEILKQLIKKSFEYMKTADHDYSNKKDRS